MPELPSPEEIVDRIIGARGDDDALVQALGGMRRQPWTDDWRMAEQIIRVVQRRGEEGLINALERSALIGHFVDSAAEARARESPRLREVERQMDRLEQECTGSTEGLLELSEAPPAYRAWEAEWRDLVARAPADWLAELGESDLARLAREQPEAFQRMIVSGEIMMAQGVDDPAEVLDAEVPQDVDLTVSLVMVALARGTRDAASLFRDIITGLWRRPDDVHAVATARFAHMLWESGHLDDNEHIFVLDAIMQPMSLALGMMDPEFARIQAQLEYLESQAARGRRTPSDDAEQDRLLGELKAARDRMAAQWLAEIDPELAELFLTDRAEFRRRGVAGGSTLLGEFVEEGKVDFAEL